jgi:hypothetical protein
MDARSDGPMAPATMKQLGDGAYLHHQKIGWRGVDHEFRFF